MGLNFHGCSINNIGIIGSGTIGPDIALYFLKALTPFGVKITLVDTSEQALENGKQKIFTNIDKGAEKGSIKPKEIESLKSGVAFTSDYSDLHEADLVIEAASEDLNIKRQIVAKLEDIIPSHGIIMSNSSHLEPAEIFGNISTKNRTLCSHFFFPADKNPALEIVPSKDTDIKVTRFISRLYEHLGKIPVIVGSAYGYAVNPVFEGILVSAIQCVESGLGSVREIDFVAAKSLGFKVGPFTAHNLTKGNALTMHGVERSAKQYGPWFAAPKSLKEAVDRQLVWDVPGKDENLELQPDKESQIQSYLLGAYFSLIGMILDMKLTNPNDLNLLISYALDAKSPFTLMNSLGIKQVLTLVKQFNAKNPSFPIPKSIMNQAEMDKPWDIWDVLYEKDKDIAIVTIKRPKALNALNSKIFKELEYYCEKIRNDTGVKAAVLTGFGNKAFVAGADIREMAGLTEPSEGEYFARKGQIASSRLEELGKPIVAALNGLAFGGGCELAMCCAVRIAPKGLRMLAGQPEVNLGLIPGMGGTQRLPRLIGFEKAAEMIRNANPISSDQALEYGLVSELVEGDVLPRAIELAREIAEGKA